MSNAATLITWDEFKQEVEKDNGDGIKVFLVRITVSDALEIKKNLSYKHNRSQKDANVLKIQKAFNEGTWDNEDCLSSISFSEKLEEFNGKIQINDGNHRITALSQSTNPDAYMDVIVQLNTKSSKHQDTGARRTEMDQILCRGIIKKDDFSVEFLKILRIFMKAIFKNIDMYEFCESFMKNNFELASKFDLVFSNKKKNEWKRQIAPYMALFNVYCLGIFSLEECEEIYEVFDDINNEKYDDKKYIPLKDLYRILIKEKNRSGSATKPQFNITMKALQRYKNGNGERVYNTIESDMQKKTLKWSEVYDLRLADGKVNY